MLGKSLAGVTDIQKKKKITSRDVMNTVYVYIPIPFILVLTFPLFHFLRPLAESWLNLGLYPVN